MSIEKPNLPTPKEQAELEKSRTLSDAELIKGGAEYKIDEETREKRLEVTKEQFLQEKREEEISDASLQLELEKLKNKSFSQLEKDIFNLGNRLTIQRGYDTSLEPFKVGAPARYWIYGYILRKREVSSIHDDEFKTKIVSGSRNGGWTRVQIDVNIEKIQNHDISRSLPSEDDVIFLTDSQIKEMRDFYNKVSSVRERIEVLENTLKL